MTLASSPAAVRGAWPRRHALFLTALTLGVVVRVVVMVAYRPALLFPDSFGYLNRALHVKFSPLRPTGYSIALRPIVLLTDSLTPIALLQHLVGIGLAVAFYVFLLRRGLPGWGATLATLPLLFDPLQLVLEHYVLSDVLFELLLGSACLVLLWRHRPSIGALVASGALIGCAGLVRGAGTFLLAVFLVAVLCLRVSWQKWVAFLIAAVVPMAGYAAAFHHEHGQYALATAGPRFLYARLAPIVQCRGLELPRYERPLCPHKAVGHRPSTDWYMWGQHKGPQWHVQPPPGMTQEQVLKDFDKRVVRAQPRVYTRAVLRDVAAGFAPSRTYQVPGYPSSYWLFQDHYWSLDTFIARRVVNPHHLDGTSANASAAGFMTDFRRWVYTPGPLLAGLLALAAAAVLGLGKARESRDRVAIGLLAATCAVPMLTGAALSGFSWRYQLPQVMLLPVAGALAVSAIMRGRATGRPEHDPPMMPLDRAAERIAGLPLPPGWEGTLRRGAQRGWLQTVLAVLVGLATAGALAALATMSGWAEPLTAAVGGLIVGLAVVAILLVARARTSQHRLPRWDEATPTGAPSSRAGRV